MMTVRFLNCFTCNARYPASLQTGVVSLLIDSNQGPLLVDTGPGLQDYARKPLILRSFQLATKVPLDPEETAVRQVAQLGYDPANFRHIVLTHMHFDHCGGLPDFPQATVHVHERELRAFHELPRRWTDFAYVRRHLAHQPAIQVYREEGERWHGFPAIRLPFEPEMWLIPLYGHSRGHCGLALRLADGWLFHMADAAPVGLSEDLPDWLVRLVLGPHTKRLPQFAADHPQIMCTTGHMPPAFFGSVGPLETADPTGTQLADAHMPA
jgi:glyoxylase-like metal-dependent hydrolase (beta-lactamase superfamily II)